MNIEAIKKEYEKRSTLYYGRNRRDMIWNFFEPYLTSKTPVSEEIKRELAMMEAVELSKDKNAETKRMIQQIKMEAYNQGFLDGSKNTSPRVDIAKGDVNKTDEELTFKNWYYEGDELVVTKGKWIVERCKRSAVSDKANIRPDKEETELDAEDQEYLQKWLQQKLSYYGLTPNQREKFAMKIMHIFRPYLSNYTGTTQVKQNIERNALIDIMFSEDVEGAVRELKLYINSHYIAKDKVKTLRMKVIQEEPNAEYRQVADSHGFEAFHIPCKLNEISGYAKAVEEINKKVDDLVEDNNE